MFFLSFYFWVRKLIEVLDLSVEAYFHSFNFCYLCYKHLSTTQKKLLSIKVRSLDMNSVCLFLVFKVLLMFFYSINLYSIALILLLCSFEKYVFILFFFIVLAFRDVTLIYFSVHCIMLPSSRLFNIEKNERKKYEIASKQFKAQKHVAKHWLDYLSIRFVQSSIYRQSNNFKFSGTEWRLNWICSFHPCCVKDNI